MAAVSRTSRTMDKRSLCCLIIFLKLGLILWVVTVQQLDTTVDVVSSTSGGGPAVAAISSPAALSMQLQAEAEQQQQQETSANGSKPNINQIHEPSRTHQQVSNFSSYYYYTYSQAATPERAVTPAPKPTAVGRAATDTVIGAATGAQLSLPASHSTQLIDLHNFVYLMAQPACEAHIQALILVHTAPRNIEKRTLIRQTWGSSSMTSAGTPLRLVFLLGRVAQHNQTLQHALELENSRHADMVQGNFQDAYRNMTYKHVMALKWFSENCAHAQMLIKVDDDVYVNSPQLIKLLREPAPAPVTHNFTLTTVGADAASPSPVLPGTAFPSTNLPPPKPSLRQVLLQGHDLMFCRLMLESRVKRSYRSKWRVSFKEFRGTFYPDYCPGFVVVYSPDVVQRLYQAAQQNDYFWVDDVHITGVLRQQTNTTITNLDPYVLYQGDCERLLNGQSELDQAEFLFTFHNIAPEQISRLWQLHVASTQNYTLLPYSQQQLDTDTGFS